MEDGMFGAKKIEKWTGEQNVNLKERKNCSIKRQPELATADNLCYHVNTKFIQT